MWSVTLGHDDNKRLSLIESFSKPKEHEMWRMWMKDSGNICSINPK